MSTPFFTILIPLYKTEPYLFDCLNSVVNQLYTNFECIVINDGSVGIDIDKWDKKYYDSLPDDIRIKLKYKPADEHAQFIFDSLVGDDNRFILYNNKNQGLGQTKNFGLAKSTGKHLIILDSDDYLTPNYLQNAYGTITNNTENNIVYAQALIDSDGKIDTFSSANKFLSPINNLKNLLFSPSWSATPVCYFWSLDLIKKYELKFKFNNKGEDTAFLFDAILAHYEEYKNKKTLNEFTLIADSYYMYRQFQNQMTKQEGFEQELFEHTTSYMELQIPGFKKIGFVEGLLAKLFVLRFGLYRKRLMAKNKLTKLIISLYAKIITALEYLIFIKF